MRVGVMLCVYIAHDMEEVCVLQTLKHMFLIMGQSMFFINWANLYVFTINPEHWSFSPNWTSFTLPQGWTFIWDVMFSSPSTKNTGLFHQTGLASPCPGVDFGIITSQSCFALFWAVDFGMLHQPWDTGVFHQLVLLHPILGNGLVYGLDNNSLLLGKADSSR